VVVLVIALTLGSHGVVNQVDRRYLAFLPLIILRIREVEIRVNIKVVKSKVMDENKCVMHSSFTLVL